MKRYIFIMLAGVLLFLLFAEPAGIYEDTSVNVTATITDIKTTDETDDGPISYRHIYYGTYTVNGQTYTNQRLTTHYTSSSRPKMHVGQTIELEVTPPDLDEELTVEEVLCLLGAGLFIYGIVKFVKTKKKAEQEAA